MSLPEVPAKTVVVPRFKLGAHVSVWWAGLRRDFVGSGLVNAWLKMRPPHELAEVDAYIFAGEVPPPQVTPAYFRGDESRKIDAWKTMPLDRVALTTENGKKILLPQDCFSYIANV